MNIVGVNCSLSLTRSGNMGSYSYALRFIQSGGPYDLTQRYVDGGHFNYDSSRNRYYLSVNYAYVGGPYASYNGGTADLYEDSNGVYASYASPGNVAPGAASVSQEDDVITVEFKKLRERWTMEDVITDVELIMDGNTPTLSFTRETVTMEKQ